jgi:aerobic-type carbon monoxide dehydrogenase small subunit (CoxS/CutS family)
MSLPSRPLTVTINGTQHGPIDVPEGMMMIDVLHVMLGLTGSRLGCGQGICHACVVIWDRDNKHSETVPTCIIEGVTWSMCSATAASATRRAAFWVPWNCRGR